MIAAFDPVPQALRDIERWILWRWVRRGDAMVKVPTRPRGDGNISAFDPVAWMSFDDAVERLRVATVNRMWGSGGGIGFTFVGDGVGGVDLDGCRDPSTGALAGWAQEVVRMFEGAYVEESPSGTGLHIIAAGAPGALGRKEMPMPRSWGDPEVAGKVPHLEAYVDRRFFTVTGRAIGDAPAHLRSCPAAWEWLVGRLGGGRAERAERDDYPDVELDVVADALVCFTSDDVDRGTWVGIAHVLQHVYGDAARETYLEWLARSPNDDADASEGIWERAGDAPPHSMSIASIFHHAIEHGWQPPWRRQAALDFEGAEIVDETDKYESGEVIDESARYRGTELTDE